jgi:hypothetical protein
MSDAPLSGLRLGIFGKGGAGKSTVTVLLARAWSRWDTTRWSLTLIPPTSGWRGLWVPGMAPRPSSNTSAGWSSAAGP